MPNSSSFRTTPATLNPRRAARSPTATGPLRVISVGSTTVASDGASTLRGAPRVRRAAWTRRGGGGGGGRRSGRLGASGGLAGRGAETGGGAWRSVGSKIWEISSGGTASRGASRAASRDGGFTGAMRIRRGPSPRFRAGLRAGRGGRGRGCHGRRRELPKRDNPPSRRCLHVRPRRSGGRGRGRGLAAARGHLLAGTADRALVQRRGVTLHRSLQAGEQVD